MFSTEVIRGDLGFAGQGKWGQAIGRGDQQPEALRLQIPKQKKKKIASCMFVEEHFGFLVKYLPFLKAKSCKQWDWNFAIGITCFIVPFKAP